jgi:hypothetical protein
VPTDEFSLQNLSPSLVLSLPSLFFRPLDFRTAFGECLRVLHHLFKLGDFLFDLKILADQVEDEVFVEGKIGEGSQRIKLGFLDLFLGLFLN